MSDWKMNPSDIDRHIMKDDQPQDAIYTQDDVDGVLAQLREAKKENELTHQLLWAIVEAAGGLVAVPHKLMTEGDATRHVIFWDDPVTYQMFLSTRAEDA